MLSQNKMVLIDYQYRLKEQLKDVLIWNKSRGTPNIVKGAFNTKWEYVFCFSYNNKTRGFPCSWQGKYPNVIETETAIQNEFSAIHKATFPIAFPEWIISKMDFAKSVLDLFLGTGTTMVAAHQLKRKCYGMELDPKYCQVIIDRMKKLDPTLTIKRNGQIL
jgi:DNA modification methylase